jgi:SAM-dependent methyltransferase
MEIDSTAAYGVPMRVSVDYAKYRQSPLERARIGDVVRLLPRNRSSVLDIGARDGFVSRLLTDYFHTVTALDLEKPGFAFSGVIPVRGDVTGLEFPDNAFEVVCCLEVLEHIAPQELPKACREIARVARHEVLIGVPFRQDTRIGQTTCSVCRKRNPPWGHVNSFNEERMQRLFPGMQAASVTFVGETRERTNALSAFLLDLAGNPWGTYNQEEPCRFCGSPLVAPAQRSVHRRALAHLAAWLSQAQSRLGRPMPIWMHVLFRKP